MVSVIGPPACTPGMVFDEESTKITLVMVKLWMLGLGTVFSSKATLANNVSAVIVTAVLGAMIVRKTVNAPLAPLTLLVVPDMALPPLTIPAQFTVPEVV